jgi:hypothetical protein
VRFETFSYRNITDKDTMFVAICKAKIEKLSTAFANAEAE